MDYVAHLDFAEKIADVLDSQFGWGPWKFGLDPIIGVVPIIGDIIPLLLSLYILWIARKLGTPEQLQRRMLVNAMADVGFGAIPIVGDLTDFVWKANSRNIRLLRKYLAERPIEGRIIAEQHRFVAV